MMGDGETDLAIINGEREGQVKVAMLGDGGKGGGRGGHKKQLLRGPPASVPLLVAANCCAIRR